MPPLLGSVLLGSVLLAPFADRMSRRQVMLLSALGQAFVIGALAVAARQPVPVALVFAALIAAELFAVPTRAAQQALVPEIVPDHGDYLTVSGAMQTIARASQVLGLVIGGLVHSASSASLAFAVDAATFLVAFLLVATLVRPRAAALAGRAWPSGWFADTREAARLAFGDAVRRSLVLLGWGAALVIGAPEAVALAYAGIGLAGQREQGPLADQDQECVGIALDEGDTLWG